MVILSLHIRSHFVEILIVVGKDMVLQVGIILANLATFLDTRAHSHYRGPSPDLKQFIKLLFQIVITYYILFYGQPTTPNPPILRNHLKE